MTTRASPMQMAQVTGVLFRIQARVHVIWKMLSSREYTKGALGGKKISGFFPQWALRGLEQPMPVTLSVLLRAER